MAETALELQKAIGKNPWKWWSLKQEKINTVFQQNVKSEVNCRILLLFLSKFYII